MEVQKGTFVVKKEKNADVAPLTHNASVDDAGVGPSTLAIC